MTTALPKNRLDAVLEEMRGSKNATEASTLGEEIKNEAYRKDPALKKTTRHPEVFGMLAAC